jgi:hypothetical protein
MTPQELVDAVDKLLEKAEVQEITLKVIKEAADRLEQKLDDAFEYWGDAND